MKIFHIPKVKISQKNFLDIVHIEFFAFARFNLVLALYFNILIQYFLHFLQHQHLKVNLLLNKRRRQKIPVVPRKKMKKKKCLLKMMIMNTSRENLLKVLRMKTATTDRRMILIQMLDIHLLNQIQLLDQWKRNQLMVRNFPNNVF